MSGKRVEVHVFSPEGKELGLAQLRPTGSLWRAKPPHVPTVHLGRRQVQVRSKDGEFRVELLPGEAFPKRYRRGGGA